jgi:hypothetical protein
MRFDSLEAAEFGLTLAASCSGGSSTDVSNFCVHLDLLPHRSESSVSQPLSRHSESQPSLSSGSWSRDRSSTCLSAFDALIRKRMERNPHVLQQQQESAHHTLINSERYDADWNSEESGEEEETTGHPLGLETGRVTGMDYGRDYEGSYQEEEIHSFEEEEEYSQSFDSLEGNLSFEVGEETEVEEKTEEEDLEDTLDECLRDLAHSLNPDPMVKRVRDSWELLREVYMDAAAATNAICRALDLTPFTEQRLGIAQRLPEQLTLFQLTAPFLRPADLIRGRIEHNGNTIFKVALDNLFIGDNIFQDFCIPYRHLTSAYISYTILLEDHGIPLTREMQSYALSHRFVSPRLVPGIETFLTPKPKVVDFFHAIVRAKLEKPLSRPEVIIPSSVVRQVVVQQQIIAESFSLESDSTLVPATLPKKVEEDDETDVDLATIIDLYGSDDSFFSLPSEPEQEPTSVEATFVDTIISGCVAVVSNGWRYLSNAVTYVKNILF